MPNPFEFISKIETMNEELCSRLDKIIEILESIRDNTDLGPNDPF